MDRTLEQKVGQMLMVGWQTADAQDIIENIKKYNFGNIILFTRNITSSNQIKDVCAQIQETAIEYNGVPCFISIDQEGGSVRRIYDTVTTVPGSMALAAASEKYPKSAYYAGKIMAEDLKSLGINFNLAPVCDINTNMNNPVIAIRSYGDDPVTVSRLAGDFAKGSQESGVMSCYKHFMGHGDVDVDSHLDLPRLNKPMSELEICELVPYKTNLIADAIMSAHILFTAIDDKFPASISNNILREFLRKKLHFEGLIVTDCFEMEGLIRTFSFEEAGMFAVKASTDIITVSHQFGRQIRARNGILQAVKDGVIPMEDIEDSNLRILKFKEKYCKNNFITPDRAKNEKIAAKISECSTTIISGKPFEIDKDTVCIGVTNYVNSIAEDVNVEKMDIASMIGDKFGIQHKSIDNKNFNVSETLSFAKNKKVVLCLADSHLTLVQKVLFTSLMQSKARVMLISMRTPYDVIGQDKPECHICTFEYTANACKSLIRVLSGGDSYGVCPVKMNKNMTNEKGEEVRNFMVENVVKYIKDNFGKRLTLDSVAEEFYITGGHLCKLFKKRIDKNFVDLLNEVRIQEAKKLLTTTAMKVYEIASLCGYTDINYFTKIFKKYMGVTPTFYRNNSKLND